MHIVLPEVQFFEDELLFQFVVAFHIPPQEVVFRVPVQAGKVQRLSLKRA